MFSGDAMTKKEKKALEVRRQENQEWYRRGYRDAQDKVAEILRALLKIDERQDSRDV